MESQGSERGCLTTAGAGILQGSGAGRGESLLPHTPTHSRMGSEQQGGAALLLALTECSGDGMGCAFLVPGVTTALVDTPLGTGRQEWCLAVPQMVPGVWLRAACFTCSL